MNLEKVDLDFKDGKVEPSQGSWKDSRFINLTFCQNLLHWRHHVTSRDQDFEFPSKIRNCASKHLRTVFVQFQLWIKEWNQFYVRSSLSVKPWFVQGWRHFHLINAEMIIWSFCKKSGHDFRIQLRLCNLWFWIWTFLFVTRLDVRYCHFISLFGTPSLFHVNSIFWSWQINIFEKLLWCSKFKFTFTR